MTNYTNVSARAMLASLHISLWRARRFDKRASDTVVEQNKAERHSGRFNKHLFGTRRAGRSFAPEFFAVLSAAEALRNTHDQNTLPWSKNRGERLLPTANFAVYNDATRKAGAAFNQAVDAFIDAYPRLVRDAEGRLGQLYVEADFVERAKLRRRYDWRLEFMPVPSSGDIRVDLPSDQVSEIERQVVASVETATREAMLDGWRRLRESVARIRKAASEDGVVRSTLIDGVRDTCDVLARLNVAQDERLEEMRKRVELELTVLSVEDLRKDDVLRADTERRAADIMSAMAAFYTPPVEDDDETEAA